MTTLLFFAFISGLITILTPCIWPLLPIILSASSQGGKKRPLGLVLGIAASFAVMTLSIAYIEKLFPVDPNAFRLFAVGVIALLGVVMVFPALGGRLEGLASRLTGPLRGKITGGGSGFWPGLGTGLVIGMVWSPCAGPILAAVATFAATQTVNFKIILVTLAYVGGLGIPLFLFALTGSAAFSRLRRLNACTGRIQQAFGIVMIVSAVLIYTNYDKAVQTRLLDAFPAYSRFLNGLEDESTVTDSLSSLQPEPHVMQLAMNDPSGLPDLGPAPDFAGITHWLNTDGPLTLNDLKGKVVLIDFWTYTCINCVRTLPHLTAWDAKYKDNGLVIIGVHTPEFAFEKNTANVARAIKQFGIHYPVAQDNDYKTWLAYGNHYWPAEYLIDSRGHIRREHFGEGEYDQMEAAIRRLLKESGQALRAETAGPGDLTPGTALTPETYLGLSRLERFSSPETPREGVQTFTFPAALPVSHVAYRGAWALSPEAARPRQGAALELRFKASKVYLVIGPGQDKNAVRVFLDGKLLPGTEAGADVANGTVALDVQRLYQLVNLKRSSGEHLLRLEFTGDGVALYAFTFG